MDVQVSDWCGPDDGCPSIRSDTTAESSTESRRPSISPPSQASDYDASVASDVPTSEWESLPEALLQLVGAQLAVSDLAAGRQTCASWRAGLSLGVESLAPLVHDGKTFLDPARWGILHKARLLWPHHDHIHRHRLANDLHTMAADAEVTPLESHGVPKQYLRFSYAVN